MQKNTSTLNIKLSRGSAATYFTCGGNATRFVGNLTDFPAVKAFCKSVNIVRNCRRKRVARFFFLRQSVVVVGLLIVVVVKCSFYSASALLAMQRAVLARGILSVCASVRPSRSGIVSRRMKIRLCGI